MPISWDIPPHTIEAIRSMRGASGRDITSPARDAVCIYGDHLRHEGPEHVMAFAPTRSGKGVGLVVPTLLSWPGSDVIYEIKGENWTLTAGCRAPPRIACSTRPKRNRPPTPRSNP